ncbi:PEP/pyruvate-binding domain-containing protein [Pirellulaceae bacterium]|nr:PEP/pyruvate-binding domain-containing protein [Pirellulaceae bacterium]
MKTVYPIVIFAIAFLCGEILQAQPGGRRRGGGPSRPRIEPEDLQFELGVAEIKDRQMFEKLSYQGPEVSRDAYLANLEFVKFIIDKANPQQHKVYFMNTQNYRAHPPYMGLVGINSRERGAITYMPRLTSPNGTVGLYIVDFQPNDSYSFDDIDRILKMLILKMPLLKGKVAFHPLRGNVDRYTREKAKYQAAKVAVYLDEDIYKDISYLPLNIAKSFGTLSILGNDGRPAPRDIVICKTLPNQMPRVAGVISETRQTPLSHVNLRAIQDGVPNAFINNALKMPDIQSLIGQLVSYEVTPQGYKLRAATKTEVEKHFAGLRPTERQVVKKNLTVTKIMPFNEITFEAADSFGAKTANLAAMHHFDLPDGMLPQGRGVPFYFYDQFMKHNGFYLAVDQMMAAEEFQSDRQFRQKSLAELRKKMELAKVPDWMNNALSHAQKTFADGTPIRCRSSTNNEDLAGFSGAGLYDSFTHHSDEGHLSKSVKQVFASLWNFRAFEEREFFKIDHKQTAMGVLLHPNFEGEQANGVGVTDDILYQTQGHYYLNTQIGEDLVTNPAVDSTPEETLLGWWEKDGYQIVRRSNQTGDNGQLLTAEQLKTLRQSLGKIHYQFAKLYKKSESDQFAMEVEFKITKQGKLVIKQARPWVF